MRGAPADFWGKLRQAENGDPIEWHPLADHCADVAACCEALLQRTLLRRRLARLGGLDDLSAEQVARLSALAAFHDVGKFNIGFQNKALAPRPPLTNGHVKEVFALLADDYLERRRLLESLPADQLDRWGDDEVGFRVLFASIGHHGRPAAIGGNHQQTPWKPARGLDPFAGIADLTQRTRRWFPEAYEEHGNPLPPAPAFQHGFSGLVMLADWLGSDTAFFPYSESIGDNRMPFARTRAMRALKSVGVDPEPPRQSLGNGRPEFGRIWNFTLHEAQRCVADLPFDAAGSVSLIEAETGSGKTEAALARYLRLFQAGLIDGMYFALPTRTAATQIHRRVREAVARAFPDEDARPPVVLAVPGYLAVDDRTGCLLPGFEVLWNDDERERYRFRGWAAEHPKRYLVGPVVVGTVDQILLSTLMVSHAHLRATALLRHLLVVDEVHASDAYMTALLREVLSYHVRAGGHALLMSATLGASARHRLLAVTQGDTNGPEPLATARLTPYPMVIQCARGGETLWMPAHSSGRSKTVGLRLLPHIGSPDEIAHAAFHAGTKSGRVLVLRNTVRDCIATQQAVEALARDMRRDDVLFRCAGVAAPHHARFAKEDREALDHALDESFGRDAGSLGRIVVATQTVQQSLDLDADLLITDLCPMDVLLQRIGRLHRHVRSRPPGFEAPTVIVLTPADRDLSARITEKGDARGAHGIGTVYDDLRILETTWRALTAREHLAIPQMNRELVEETTHPEALDAIVAELGGRWPAHAHKVIAIQLAHRRLADYNIVDRSKPFGDFEFPSDELRRHIQTRLGEDDRLLDLPEPILGPFGAPIQRLSIPAYLVRGIGSDARPAEVAHDGTRLTFAFGTRQFIYDRLGLRGVQTLPPEEEEMADA